MSCSNSLLVITRTCWCHVFGTAGSKTVRFYTHSLSSRTSRRQKLPQQAMIDAPSISHGRLQKHGFRHKEVM